MMQGDTLSEPDTTPLTQLLNTLLNEIAPETSRRVMQPFTNAMLRAAVDPVIVYDAQWQVMQMNPAAHAIFGASDSSAAAMLDALVRSERFSVLLRDGQPSFEWQLSDERVFIPHVQTLTLEESVEPSMLVIVTLHDVSQFKKLNRNHHEFMRIVSHDLRSPLTTMLGFANMLELQLVGELNAKQHEFIEKIMSGISQMTALVENIQDAGRFDPETGFYEMLRSQADLAEVVTRIVRNYLVPAEKQDLTISVSIADDVPIINADTNMLERAITNLVDNAIKYTPNGGKILVSVSVRDEQVVIGVQDTGFGISPENQKLLFHRHVRLPREEHKRVKGSGLGLFIVKSVAQRHNGDAWVESVEGQGSTFLFSIPLNGANRLLAAPHERMSAEPQPTSS